MTPYHSLERRQPCSKFLAIKFDERCLVQERSLGQKQSFGKNCSKNLARMFTERMFGHHPMSMIMYGQSEGR